MYAIAMCGVLAGLAVPTGPAATAAWDRTDSSFTIVLVQSGTGAGPGTGTGLDTGKSGSGKETDAGRGTVGKESPFGSDQPRTGDFSPNATSATRNPPNTTDVDKTAGSNYPSGIGEKGSGQTRSTTERSGGPHPSASESMAKSSAEQGEGKSEHAAKDLKSQKPGNR